MTRNSGKIVLSIRDNDHCKRLADPINKDSYFHMEVFLPFSEAAKIEKGNANMRSFNTNKPAFKAMWNTVQDEPGTFHLKNRGITYLCSAFHFDNQLKQLTISNPEQLPFYDGDEDDDPRFGIGDGGHTFEILQRTVA